MPTRQVMLFPFAGASSQSFDALRRWIPQMDVIAVDYPGHHVRHAEPLLGSIPELAHDCWDRHQMVLRDGCVLVGASMGALVAFEFAHIAARSGCTPAALVSVSAAAPGRHGTRSRIAALSDADFADALRDRYPGEPSAVVADPDHHPFVLQSLRADIAAFENYGSVTSGAVDAPVLALSGTRDRAISFADLLAWSDRSVHDADVLRIDGGHFLTLDSAPRVAGEVLVWLDKLGLQAAPQPKYAPPTASVVRRG